MRYLWISLVHERCYRFKHGHRKQPRACLRMSSAMFETKGIFYVQVKSVNISLKLRHLFILGPCVLCSELEWVNYALIIGNQPFFRLPALPDWFAVAESKELTDCLTCSSTKNRIIQSKTNKLPWNLSRIKGNVILSEIELTEIV